MSSGLAKEDGDRDLEMLWFCMYLGEECLGQSENKRPQERCVKVLGGSKVKLQRNDRLYAG